MAGRKRDSQNEQEVKNPLSGFAASPFLSRLAREGGRRQRGGAALARRPLVSTAPVSDDVRFGLHCV
ncbi:hypothetical protein EAG14_21810 [Acidovorax sp. 1608163]|nr:hypothetical protein EAG14_21810 [Acidovorax sp. 1608163]